MQTPLPTINTALATTQPRGCMMIEVIKPADARLPGAYRTEEVFASSTDVNFFNSAMTPSAYTSPTVDQPTPKNLLTDTAGKLTGVTERMSKSLRALGSTDKLDEARKYPGQLSDALLLQLMLTKCVGKTAQCIDKISNLQ
ncbi:MULTISPECIES: EscI/YscI/HrpB family type III secretion system inner rod protein [unclassified Pseudomonas]|nr:MULTISPECIES: EscI/YscI/HrpB family type III secretion system inner rod protein [unclassified Pseudomonas]